MESLAGATLLITGGTGSFGHAVLERYLASDVGQIRIFSRDEKKQDDMRHDLQARFPGSFERVRFAIGDVRDFERVCEVMDGVDLVFHAAALKEVPSCEFFPMEAVRTNVLGTENVLRAAVRAHVGKVVCLSTDKAAYPINAMGMSKAMMEKVAASYAHSSQTVVCCTRYGNVMCSRGSVIPLFVEQALAGRPLTVTDPAMTRFLMSLDEAVDLVEYAFEHAEPGDLFVQKAPACTVGDLAEAVAMLFGSTGVRIIGTRHGEKLYETLVTREERLRACDQGRYFRIPADARGLNYDKFFVEGQTRTQAEEAYTSHVTERLDAAQTAERIAGTAYVRAALEHAVGGASRGGHRAQA